MVSTRQQLLFFSSFLSIYLPWYLLLFSPIDQVKEIGQIQQQGSFGKSLAGERDWTFTNHDGGNSL